MAAAAVPPGALGTASVTILLLVGSGSLAAMTFPATELEIWNICPDGVETEATVLLDTARAPETVFT